jgi:group I intron endonuclease
MEIEKFLTYVVINKINGKCYVGSHVLKKDKDKYIGSGNLIKQSIKKYGRKNFIRLDLKFYQSILEARYDEKYYINMFDTLTPNGYNISPTGGMGDNNFGRHSNISKKKSSISQKKRFEDPKEREKISIRFKNKSYIELYGEIDGNILKNKRKISLEKNNPTKGKFGKDNVNFGKTRTQEQRNNISKSLKDKPKSDIHKQHLSDAWEIRKIEKPHTEETLKKMKESMMGKNVGKGVKIYEFENSDGLIHQTINGLVKFAKLNHIHPGKFRDLIQGKRKEYKGWKYIKTIKE